MKSRSVGTNGAAGLYLALSSDGDFLRLLMVLLEVQINRNHRNRRDWAQSSATHDERERGQTSSSDCRRNQAAIWCRRRCVRRSNCGTHGGQERRFRQTGSSVPGSLEGDELRANPAPILMVDPEPDCGSSLTAVGPSGSSVSASIDAMLGLTICMNRVGRRGLWMHNNGRKETGANGGVLTPERRLRSGLRAKYRRP